MSMVSIDNLAPGMVLSASVQDKSGRLLLAEGVALEVKHLLIFRTWGIAEADIIGIDDADANPLQDEITQEKLELAREKLLPLYHHTDIEHPAIRELLRLAVIRKAKKCI